MPSNEQDYEVDPYSAWVSDVIEASKQATVNRGAMNETEAHIIATVIWTLQRLDPAIVMEGTDA